ncbi:MAG: ATP-binding protein [Chloroflexota bacterium]
MKWLKTIRGQILIRCAIVITPLTLLLAIYLTQPGSLDGTPRIYPWTATILTAVAAILGCAWLIIRTLRVINQFAHHVDQVSKGHLKRRLNVSDESELSELARAINRLTKKHKSQVDKRDRERDQLETVLDTMTDGMLILTKKGNVRLINAAAARILETDIHKAMRKSFVRVVNDHRLVEFWQRSRDEEHEIDETVEFYRSEIGEEQFLRVVVTPFTQGAEGRYLVMLQDLTRMKRLQTMRQDFVSNVSHELRTPLASLRALVDTLQEGALDDPPAAKRFLYRMEAEVDTLTEMVQELLSLSHMESGQMPLAIEPTPAVDILQNSIERLRPQSQRAQVVLNGDWQGELPMLMADSGKIEQVVTNLIHNAIKFTPPNGQILVSATANHAPNNHAPNNHAPNNMDAVVAHRHFEPASAGTNAKDTAAEETDTQNVLTIRISDTGIGIPQQDLSRVFERFYKTDRARTSGGTGLGLAICKHIVQAHNGEIWVESVEGQGSTFSFSLPVL